MRRKANHCPEMRKRMARKAWAMFSGRTNCGRRVSGTRTTERMETYLVELIAEVYRVDVVALEVGEHDDLWVGRHGLKVSARDANAG